MALDDTIRNGSLRIGEMPSPQYLVEAPDTTGSGNIKWIGVCAYSLEKKIEDFLWWKNVRIGDISNDETRRNVAEQIAGLDAAIVIGAPVDFHRSNPSREQVAILEEPGVYGVYVEAEKRPMFNFMVDMGGERSRLSPREFQVRVNEILAVMPYPAGGTHEKITLVNGVPIKIHRAKSDIIIINYPGISGDIDGYNNKYGQLADFIVEKGIGAVVRMGNQDHRDYPNGMINNFKRLVEYALMHSEKIGGTKSPRVYLMGFSAGASTIAAVAGDFSEVEKILLMAPSGDAGQEAVKRGLGKFTGEVYIAVGSNDEVVGPQAGQTFYDMATVAKLRKLEIIPNCDHQFRGEVNGRIMSKAPLWAFVGDTTFPSPKGGKVLYR